MYTQLDFSPGNINNFVLLDKKNLNSKNFAHISFFGPKVSTKCSDFAAGPDCDS